MTKRAFSMGDLLQEAVRRGASDLHLTALATPMLRVNGQLVPIGEQVLTADDTTGLLDEIIDEQQLARLQARGDVDFSYSFPGASRFRVNAYRQRGSVAVAVRVISPTVRSWYELGLPEVVADLARRPDGLVIVTGPTGSGKSTTLAAMVDLINSERRCHIITLEDPIEYLHRHKRSLVNQREIGVDSQSFADGLRAALREDPDIIMVGEMRDLETVSIALRAAETGHLVLATLHTNDAAGTIDRLVDVFPPHQQQQIRVQLAATLQGIIAQQLLPRADGSGRVGAYEILVATTAVRNLIREGKTHQIPSSIQTGARHGMKPMSGSLKELYAAGLITEEVFQQYGAEFNTGQTTAPRL
ncbi:MAG: type IV pilus twitching motility protein PilT [Bacillota bacterium]